MIIQFFLQYHTQFGQTISVKYINTNSPDVETRVAMTYYNQDFWSVSIDIKEEDVVRLRYKYEISNTSGNDSAELGFKRRITPVKQGTKLVKLLDIWNYSGAFENAFETMPFQQTLLPQQKEVKLKLPKTVSHMLKIKAPLLQQDEVVCVLGNIAELGNWDEAAPQLLQKSEGEWMLPLTLLATVFPVVYKYGVYHKKEKRFIRFEEGDNRVCFEAAQPGETVVLNDGFIRVPNHTWKGAGVAIPVFSLRSQDSLGVGEFTDIKLLVDWAHITGLQMVQLLPVNDTIATHTYKDSYPYAAISAFALHPVYINVEKAAGKRQDSLTKSLKEKKEQLNDLPEVDYVQVIQYKLQVLKEIFKVSGGEILATPDYQQFFKQNQHWLKPYAAFSYLRDKYGTSDFNQWKTNKAFVEAEIDRFFETGSAALEQVGFYCFLQYHAHLQLKEAVAYAHQKNIIIKGDIPIGVYRYGCDAWVAPELYNMHLQAGAPPDDFAAVGQNWGFPTYNWQQMQANGFEWWQQRFEQMSNYFDTFRIDHILGFFRIWSIPENAVQGIMGRFDPALPIAVNEFGEQGIWFNKDRFCNPYITDEVLRAVFKDHWHYVREKYFTAQVDGIYFLNEKMDTQQKVQQHFSELEQNELNLLLQNGFFDLVSNVILFEEPGSHGQSFHFRIGIDKTTSYQHLDDYTKQRLWHLYTHYFFKKQDWFWEKESLKKLPQLKESTNMLICGEDLGMVPDCVPEVMRDLGILSLEIQRMPKQLHQEFMHLAHAPYLSVVTPSTHDMSTVRGWWEEDRKTTQRFYNQELGLSGNAPYFCEPWVARAIVLQHLYAPAMWSVFQLQDLLGMSEKLRRENPHEERINVPANPNHYWRYRMHIYLEDLIQEAAFNQELRGYIVNSGRRH